MGHVGEQLESEKEDPPSTAREWLEQAKPFVLLMPAKKLCIEKALLWLKQLEAHTKAQAEKEEEEEEEAPDGLFA